MERAPEEPLDATTGHHVLPMRISTLACQVCGRHDLQEVDPCRDLVEGLGARLQCQECGAHRVLGT